MTHVQISCCFASPSLLIVLFSFLSQSYLINLPICPTVWRCTNHVCFQMRIWILMLSFKGLKGFREVSSDNVFWNTVAVCMHRQVYYHQCVTFSETQEVIDVLSPQKQLDFISWVNEFHELQYFSRRFEISGVRVISCSKQIIGNKEMRKWDGEEMQVSCTLHFKCKELSTKAWLICRDRHWIWPRLTKK